MSEADTLDWAEIARKVLAPSPEAAIAVGMVLAAGRGARLGLLGRQCPKALLEIAGEPLLDQALHAFKTAGITRAVVNAAHLKEQIVAHLAARPAPLLTTLSLEDEPLETGGGVVHALAKLGPDPFYAVNADIWWSGALPNGLATLRRAWRPAAMDVLLLMMPTVRTASDAGRGDFFIDGIGALRRKQEQETAPFIFTGAQILTPTAFAEAPKGAFSLNKIYDRAEARGRLFGVIHSGAWADIGTPRRLATVRAAADAGRQEQLL